MKKITLLWFLCFTNIALTQEKMITHEGLLYFEASVPLFEEIKARNEIATCILNTKTGEIFSLALVKNFRFKMKLMEDHFNENYMESNRYPKATFKGIIEDFNYDNICILPKEFKLKGRLTLHGQSKLIATTLFLRKTGDGLEIISNFNINSDDYNIKIPQMLSMKVSKIVNINTRFIVKDIYLPKQSLRARSNLSNSNLKPVFSILSEDTR